MAWYVDKQLREGRHMFNPGPEAVEKVKLQMEISGFRNEPSIKNIISLLNILLGDVRKENDRALIRTVLRNQGRIAAYQDLLDMITKDYPV